MIPPASKNELIELIRKYQQKKASPEEISFIEKYYRYFDKEEPASANLTKKDKELLEKKIFQKIGLEIDGPVQMPVLHINRNRNLFVLWPARAAVMILLLGIPVYLLISRNHVKETSQIKGETNQLKNDMAPGGNKAVLTLGNGSTIVLDSAGIGKLAQQGNSNVVKTDHGRLAYNAVHDLSPATTGAEVVFNTLTTPRGGQYRLTLPDGSQVWLNAASSIHYPTVFTGNERKVELSGEAYFEVTKNARMPFKVKVNQTEVEVLGTHFNINAYPDEESEKTTLLEGSVKLSVAPAFGHPLSSILKPGEQAQVLEGSMPRIRVVGDADTGEAVAWKNGMFQFRSADIETIMRQVARWYDVDIIYEKKIDEKFYAEISRNTNASNIFRILELTGAVHFKIDGRKVILSP